MGVSIEKKIGKFLGLRLVEEVSMGDFEAGGDEEKSEGLTIGDLIKIKKR